MLEQMLNIDRIQISPLFKRLAYFDSELGIEAVSDDAILFYGQCECNQPLLINDRPSFSISPELSTTSNITGLVGKTLNLSDIDFTVEWTTLYGKLPIGNYLNEFTMTGKGDTYPIVIRFNDGEPMSIQLKGSPIKRIPYGVSQASNTLMKWTLVCKDGELSVYMDDKLITFNDGTTSVAIVKDNFTDITGIILGGWSSGTLSSLRNVSSVEIVSGARIPDITD